MNIKQILCFTTILFFSIFSSYLLCQNNEDIFNQANCLYKKGQFEEALTLYQKIPNKSGYVHYNLGNCAYKLKKFGYALLYWKRAEKDWNFFNRDELLDNIDLLKKELEKQQNKIKKKKILPFFVLLKKIKSLSLSWIRSMPLIVLQILFLILWLFLFFYLKFLYKTRKKLLIIGLFSSIAICGIILVIRYSFESRKYGIIINKKAELLSGPSNTFQTLIKLQEATEVTIQKESDGFFKIKVNKQSGWINKKCIEKI